MKSTFSSRILYLDHAASTPLRDEVKHAIVSGLELFGNPSSAHQVGYRASEVIESARSAIGQIIGAASDDRIVFTSGGTEANNLAIKGILSQAKKPNPHVVTTAIEHTSVLAVVEELKSTGVAVSVVSPGRDGVVSAQDVADAIRPNTALVSAMLVNNETGAVQPTHEIGAEARRRGIPFHCDAVQSFGKMRHNLHELHVDLLSISGHKIGAPKGVGALVIAGNVALAPLFHGGHQEGNARAGTENTLGILALGAAAKALSTTIAVEIEHFSKLKLALVERLKREIPGIVFHGDPLRTAPHILSVSFDGLEAEAIVTRLDAEGICVSRGSACSAARIEPSHVLSAMGVPSLVALGAIRFSFGIQNRLDDLDFLMPRLRGVVESSRRMSPFQINAEGTWASSSQ